MELLTLILSFVVAVSFLLEPCVSDTLYVQHYDQLTRPSLPRKLNFHEDKVKTSADEHKNFEQPLSDTKQQEKEKKVSNAADKGRVFEEGPNKSEYFTMDYGWVRRRRPIHNKQIPFLP